MTKALRLAGIPSAAIRVVPVDHQCRLDPAALRRMIRQDRDAGHRPFLACASAGTVNTGAVDPLDTIADVCAEEEVWYHVDGAYGALFRLVPELASTLAGMERADSLVLDPHKGLFLPYGTGVLLVRDVAALERAHGDDAAYLPPKGDGEEHIDFCNLTPELSRDWRGLRLWLPFMLHGVAAFRDALRDKRRLALRAAEALAEQPDVVLAHAPELSLFAFRQSYPGLSRSEENARNRALLDRINEPRRVMLTSTEIDGTFWLRVCVLHLRTHQSRLDEALNIVRTELDRGR
jgi:aromatic-L-amino-acid decarboxylase